MIADDLKTHMRMGWFRFAWTHGPDYGMMSRPYNQTAVPSEISLAVMRLAHQRYRSLWDSDAG